ncbi:MAG: HAMP domain-containing sensor histidine kinase [Thermodesulfobacteriota bacterium]|nr:HAMP domain-containing sensor histidine kinase [Thermodesulfobacteriota bacterium]
MKKPFTLRSEIVISSSLLVGAALLFVALLLLRLCETHLLEQNITLRSRNAQSLSGLLSGKSATAVSPLIKAYAKTNQLSDWCLSDNNDQFIAGDKQLFNPGKSLRNRQTLLWQPLVLRLHYLPGWQSLLGNNNSYRYADLSVAITTDSGQRLTLQIRYLLDDIYQQILALQKIALACCLAYGLVLVVTAVFLLNRAVIQPIMSLTKSTQQISEGDLNQRATLAGPFEITTLGQSFNLMTENLQYSALEQQRQLEALQRTNRELQLTQQHLIQSERMASVGNLTSGMAHELGNPLSAVIGYLELLKKQDLPEKELDLASRALAESGRMDQLLKDMLDFAAPKTSESDAQCHPATVVKQTCELLQQQGVLKQHTLINQVFDDLPVVTMDPHKLQQVLVNLLINARDASSGKQMTTKGVITIGGMATKESVEIKVEDNGHGISTQQQQAIFDPFYTTKAPGKGRGLGLYVCYQLMRDCGGQLSVASTPNQGSCFTLTMPVKENIQHDDFAIDSG